ncbi:Mov34/MPN/PAD-1 family protein [Paenibacillus antarcticus]|uniref:MPN domain-containing protein n=1 Tax=Paenibacillus antarcticus TaxID=253703 RepID=A0A168LP44_9BACL|nr:Mov34/MPN/PAD-1 family protein [Paenibacillus antarcticus]OAB43661.1 hypothetical protein PBAT_17490 [Paenibacillus antarcticus]
MTKLLVRNEEVLIHAAAARELATHTLLHLPHESCGVLLGTAAAGSIQIEKFHPIRNVAPDPLHAFTFHPEEWIKFCLHPERLVGIVHSHPHSQPIPSQDDLTKLNGYGQLLDAYLICSPNESSNSIIIHSYRIIHPSFHSKTEINDNFRLLRTQLTVT